MPSDSRTPPARPAPESTLWFEPIFALIPREVTQVSVRKGGMLYGQGQKTDGVYFVKRGVIRRSVRSRTGQEATVAVVTPGGFCGEGCLSGQPFRVSSATAISTAAAVKVQTAVLVRALHDMHALSEAFLAHLLARSIIVEEDICGRIFTQLETRLAGARLKPSRFGHEAAQAPFSATAAVGRLAAGLRLPAAGARSARGASELPRAVPGDDRPVSMTISQKALAELIGAHPSRLSSAMNQFRTLGLVDYDGKTPSGEIRVHPMLLADVVLGE